MSADINILEMKDWILPFPLPIVIALISIGVSILLFIVKANREGVDKSRGLASEEQEKVPEGSLLSKDERVLHPALFKKFKLVKSVKASHNTKLLTFEIPDNKCLGLPIGRHISLMVHLDGNKVIRPYTPVSRPDQKGHFEILIKTYNLGKMSPFLFSMPVGDSIDVRGPVGRFKYAPNMYKHIGLVCAGTGLTPPLQVIRCILEGEQAASDQTRMTLIYQNRMPQDVLMRDTLTQLEETHPDRLRVFYCLSNPSDEWGVGGRAGKEIRGYVTTQLLRDKMPLSDCDLVGLCGPSGFNDQMLNHLESIGFEKNKNIYVW